MNAPPLRSTAYVAATMPLATSSDRDEKGSPEMT
jgi:hypothetical protein